MICFCSLLFPLLPVMLKLPSLTVLSSMKVHHPRLLGESHLFAGVFYDYWRPLFNEGNDFPLCNSIDKGKTVVVGEDSEEVCFVFLVILVLRM